MSSLAKPNDIEAEKEILAACFKGGGPSLNQGDIVKKVIGSTGPDYFEHPHYKKIFIAMHEAVMDKGDAAVDYGDVRGQIVRESAARDTLKDIVTNVKTPPITEYFINKHIEKLANAYMGRRIAELVMQSKSDALAGNSQMAFDTLASGIVELSKDRFDLGAKYVKEYVPNVLEEIDERRTAEGGIVGLRTGIKAIDDGWKGLEKRKVYFIGARPGNYKSVSIGQVCFQVADNYPEKRVLLASTEMDAEHYMTRMAATMAGINYADFTGGNYSEEQGEKMKTVVRAMNDKRIIINPNGGQDTNSLRQDIIAYQPDLLLMDYLQEFYPSKSSNNEYADVSRLVRELNIMKKHFNLPILCAVQLSRAVEQRENKRPIESDIRASGWLEQAASGIFGLYRPAKYAASKEQVGKTTMYYDAEGNEIDGQLVEWVNLKNRDGNDTDYDTYVKPGEMLLKNERAE